jgi:hypothetical protein
MGGRSVPQESKNQVEVKAGRSRISLVSSQRSSSAGGPYKGKQISTDSIGYLKFD